MVLVGSRAKVMHGTADKTSGGLTSADLKYNKYGKIVSRKASNSAKKSNNLKKAGYTTVKGQFGSVYKHKGGETNNNSTSNNEKKEYWKKVSLKRKEIVNTINKNNTLKNDISKIYEELIQMEKENKQNDDKYRTQLEEFMRRTGMTHVNWYKCIKSQQKYRKKNIKKE